MKQNKKIEKWEDLTKEQQNQIKGKMKEIFKLREILGINQIEEEISKLKELLTTYKTQAGGNLSYLG